MCYEGGGGGAGGRDLTTSSVGKNFIKSNAKFRRLHKLAFSCGISISSLVNLPTANWPVCCLPKLAVGHWLINCLGQKLTHISRVPIAKSAVRRFALIIATVLQFFFDSKSIFVSRVGGEAAIEAVPHPSRFGDLEANKAWPSRSTRERDSNSGETTRRWFAVRLQLKQLSATRCRCRCRSRCSCCLSICIYCCTYCCICCCIYYCCCICL